MDVVKTLPAATLVSVFLVLLNLVTELSAVTWMSVLQLVSIILFTVSLFTDSFAFLGMCDHGKCINMEGSFRCVCDPGYRLGSDGRHCFDIDECISNPCQFGTCYNTPGSFRCECHSGFSLGSDGRSCLDTRRDLCYQVSSSIYLITGLH